MKKKISNKIKIDFVSQKKVGYITRDYSFMSFPLCSFGVCNIRISMSSFGKINKLTIYPEKHSVNGRNSSFPLLPHLQVKTSIHVDNMDLLKICARYK